MVEENKPQFRHGIPPVFHSLSIPQSTITEEQHQLLERFVILIYKIIWIVRGFWLVYNCVFIALWSTKMTWAIWFCENSRAGEKKTSTTSRISLICSRIRQSLFSQGRSIKSIPPTQADLEQYSRRAAYQSGHVWGRTLDTIQEVPSPKDCGWQLSNSIKWIPTRTTLLEASKVCKELIKCGCKQGCCDLCKCTKVSLSWTALCHCAGHCYED